MCDNCLQSKRLVETNVTKYLCDLVSILDNASNNNERMTALKLMDAWFQRGNKKLRLDNIEAPDIDRHICEQIIGLFLIDGYLKEDFHFTPYSTISYLIVGPRFHTRPKDHKICYYLNVSPKRTNGSTKSTEKSKKLKSKEKSSEEVICLE